MPMVEDRNERLAATLEGHLAKCDAMVAACFEGRTPNDLLSEWPLSRMVSLMKMSTQLAQAISRIEAQAPKIAKSEV
jgi:hypothetical protein